MAHVLAPRVGETTTTEGVGAYTVTGAIPGAQWDTFAARMQAGDYFYGFVEEVDADGVPNGHYEEGRYTMQADGTIARTEIHDSSNAGAAVNWGIGTKRIRIGLTARLARSLVANTVADNSVVTNPGGEEPDGGTPPPTGTPQARPYIVDGTIADSFFGNLVFSDEFSGTSLDQTKWNPYQTFWQNAEAVGSNYYDVVGGDLRMWLNKTEDSNAGHGVINTEWKCDFKYVYMECRAKIGSGRGAWPGIWTYASDGHADAGHEEIDIMEAYPGGAPQHGQYWANADYKPVDYASTVWPSTGSAGGAEIGHYNMSTTFGLDNILSDGYFTYGCLWENDGVTFYFEGQRFGQKLACNLVDFHMFCLQAWEFYQSDVYTTDPTLVGDTTRASRYSYVRIWELANGTTQVRTNLSLAQRVDPLSGTDTTGGGTGGGGTGTGTIADVSMVQIWGDSTVWGYKATAVVGSQVTTTMPEQFATSFDFPVENRGVNSVTSQHILEGSGPMEPHGGWFDNMAVSDASHVLCMVGINDAAAGHLRGEFQYWQSRICRQAVAAGKKFCFLTNNPTSTMNTADYAQWTRETASAEGAPCIDVYTFCLTYMSSNNISMATAFPDGIHPSEAMYIAIGNYVAEQFTAIYG